ncbi:Transposon Tf2-9 poly, partial [Paramuricea clavata]
ANGQVERFNGVIKKHVLTAQAEQKDWRESLPNLLLHYRTTPHRITGQSPAKLLMKRELRTKIPAISTVDQPTDWHEEVRRKDDNEKSKAKAYTDKKRHAAERKLIVGDKVLVKQKKKNKYSTKFCKDPMTITKINGTQIVLTDLHGKQHRRNSSHVKKYWTTSEPNNVEDEDFVAEFQPPQSTTEETPPDSNPNIPIIQPDPTPLRRSTREKTVPDRLRY